LVFNSVDNAVGESNCDTHRPNKSVKQILRLRLNSFDSLKVGDPDEISSATSRKFFYQFSIHQKLLLWVVNEMSAGPDIYFIIRLR
jgi:hypothetical protein